MSTCHTASVSRFNVGYQMAYARWVQLRLQKTGTQLYSYFGLWAQMQGQLNNPRPYSAVG